MTIRKQRWMPKDFGIYCWDLLDADQKAIAAQLATGNKSRLWPWLADTLTEEQLQIVAGRLDASVCDRMALVDRVAAAVQSALARGERPTEEQLNVLQQWLESKSRTQGSVNSGLSNVLELTQLVEKAKLGEQ